MAPKPQLMLSEVIALHLEMRIGQRQEASTVTKHRLLLTAFLKANGDMKIGNINAEHLEHWRAERCMHRKSNGKMLAHSYLNDEKKNIASFFEWARAKGHYKKVNPAADLKDAKGLDHDFLRLSADRWPELLAAADCARDRALFAAGLFTLARSSEIASIAVGDLQPLLDGSPGVVITRWKTKERDHIPISLDFQDELDRWLKIYKAAMWEQGEQLSPEHRLIPSYRNGPAHVIHGADGTFQSVQYFNAERSPARKELQVHKALVVMGLRTEQEGMHMLRRSGALAFYTDLVSRVAAGEVLPAEPIRIVMSLLGHKKQKTTEDYLGLKSGRTARDQVMIGRRMIERTAPPAVQSTPIDVKPARRLSVVRNVS